jgi:hypothetical protein
MAMYVLYPIDERGLAPVFTARELAPDGAANALADSLLTEHPQCAYIAIWQDNRRMPGRSRRV